MKQAGLPAMRGLPRKIPCKIPRQTQLASEITGLFKQRASFSCVQPAGCRQGPPAAALSGLVEQRIDQLFKRFGLDGAALDLAVDEKGRRAVDPAPHPAQEVFAYPG